MTKLRVLILSDGVPGHVNQARGLVHWLSKRYELVCSEQAVSLRARPAARVLLPYALKVRGIGANVGKAFYRTNGLDGTPPDLIISAGGNTSFLNIALAIKDSLITRIHCSFYQSLLPQAEGCYLSNKKGVL